MTGTGVAVVDGRRVHYRRAGTEGTPVVLLHGGGVDDSVLSWKHAIRSLSEDHRVYAPDWPGYGGSDPIPDPSIERYVDVLEGFLDDVGLDAATLVGISMGGAAALGFTLDHPARVERLGLVAPYGLGPRITAGSWWYAMAHTPGANTVGWNVLGSSAVATRTGLSTIVHDASSLPEDFVTELQARASEFGAGSAFAAFQRNEVTPGGRVRTDYSDRLDEVETPTLLVHGTSDTVFPPEWSRRAAERLPDASLELLDECGHWVPRERRAAFEARLRAFC